MNQPIRIMIDMETLATGPDAGILSLGACTFGLPFGTERQTFYMKASMLSNEQLGRKISRSTMEWWNTQDKDVRAEAFSGTHAVDDVLDGFAKWTRKLIDPYYGGSSDNRLEQEYIELWSRGAGFDCEIMQHAFYQIFGSYPFDFRKHMCQRTVERLMPPSLKNGVIQNLQKHHALHDALNQADTMDVALRNLNWSGAM